MAAPFDPQQNITARSSSETVEPVPDGGAPRARYIVVATRPG